MIYPNFNQSITYNSVGGVSYGEQPPVGTHILYKTEAKGLIEGEEIPYDMIMSITVLDRESINGNDCIILDFNVEMDMTVENESLIMTFNGKEWRDNNGTPQKMEGEVSMDFFGVEIPFRFTSQLMGEEQYQGRDCWIFSGIYEMGMMGVYMSNVEVTQYIDKSSYAVIRQINDDGEMEIDSGYIEAATYVAELEWVLDGRETITTDLGTFDCQVIYLQDNGKTVGKIWAHKDFRAPLQYEITFEMVSMDMEVTLELSMVLAEYIWG